MPLIVVPPPGFWPEPEGEGPWRKRIVRGADPAAGAEISVTVDQGRLWVVHAIRVALVTDATVATRAAALLCDDGTTVFVELPAALTQAASLTVNYSWGTVGASVSEAGVRGISVLPSPLVLLRGYRIRSSTTNLQAGDNFGAPVLYVDELMEK